MACKTCSSNKRTAAEGALEAAEAAGASAAELAPLAAASDAAKANDDTHRANKSAAARRRFGLESAPVAEEK